MTAVKNGPMCAYACKTQSLSHTCVCVHTLTQGKPAKLYTVNRRICNLTINHTFLTVNLFSNCAPLVTFQCAPWSMSKVAIRNKVVGKTCLYKHAHTGNVRLTQQCKRYMRIHPRVPVHKRTIAVLKRNHSHYVVRDRTYSSKSSQRCSKFQPTDHRL